MARFVITDPSARTQIFEITSPTISVGRADPMIWYCAIPVFPATMYESPSFPAISPC